MKIKSFQGGYDKNLSYLVWCEDTKFAAIIDPSVNITQIFEQIEKLELSLIKHLGLQVMACVLLAIAL